MNADSPDIDVVLGRPARSSSERVPRARVSSAWRSWTVTVPAHPCLEDQQAPPQNCMLNKHPSDKGPGSSTSRPARRPRAGGQDCGCKADTAAIRSACSTRSRTRGWRTATGPDPSHDLPLRQAPVTHQAGLRLSSRNFLRSACLARNPATSASTAWPTHAARPVLCRTLLSGS